MSPILVGSIDVAELVMIGFFAFFLGLVLWIRREDRREGYPLEDTATGRIQTVGSPFEFDNAKVFRLPFGLGRVIPERGKREPVKIAGTRRTARFASAPIEPVGDPFTTNAGPGAWAERAHRADYNAEGHPRIRPLRLAPGFHLDRRDPDPTGYSVVGADGVIAGKVEEIWVDTSDHLVRYYGVALTREPARLVLVPYTFSTVSRSRRAVFVEAINGAHFAGIPPIASPDQITLYEEERVVAYFGAGLLYATPERAEPIL